MADDLTGESAVAWMLGRPRIPDAGPVRHRRARGRGPGGRRREAARWSSPSRRRRAPFVGTGSSGAGPAVDARGPPAVSSRARSAATRATSTPPGSWPAGPRWAPRSTRRPCRRKCATTRSGGYPTPRAATPDRRPSPASTSAVTPTASCAVSPGASRALPTGGARCWPGSKEVGTVRSTSTVDGRDPRPGDRAAGGGAGRRSRGGRSRGEGGALPFGGDELDA